jgi:DNA-binding NarL/FixJ family response regulator
MVDCDRRGVPRLVTVFTTPSRPEHRMETTITSPVQTGGLEALTRRELEVLSLLAAGWSNEGIRDALCLSPKTVESHVHSIFLKLDLPRGSAVHARVLAARIWLAGRLGA